MPIFTVEATDEDEGDNAEVLFDLEVGVPFSIDEESGEIRVAEELDYEKKSSYTVSTR